MFEIKSIITAFCANKISYAVHISILFFELFASCCDKKERKTISFEWAVTVFYGAYTQKAWLNIDSLT